MEPETVHMEREPDIIIIIQKQEIHNLHELQKAIEQYGRHNSS